MTNMHKEMYEMHFEIPEISQDEARNFIAII